ncbi:MAG: extracellular solute-binding protein [Minisyncoccota bacterium]
MSKFQTGLLIVFGVFIIIAVILFSRSRGGGSTSLELDVWGTISERDFENILTSSGLAQGGAQSFDYTMKEEGKFSSEFTEALAVGRGPDLIILPVDGLQKEKSKILLIPNESVKPADFLSTFVKEGELFQTTEGTYALPMYMDPMVLYWNRDLLAGVALAAPLVYWDQIYDYVSKLTIKDNAGNLTQSAIALGEARNIPHAKEILSLLMLQAGTPITVYSGGELRSVLTEGMGSSQLPAIAALEFYTQFANPAKSYYSWNRSQLSADTHFTSGKSAMYLGFASELPVLKAKNPTMDIAIAPVPQSRASGQVSTFARLYGVAIARSASNPASALAGVLALVSNNTASALASVTPYIPTRRDLLSNRPGDPAGFVFYAAALQSEGWLDPDPFKTETIFTEMVESVTSGRARVDTAISNANASINTLVEEMQ